MANENHFRDPTKMIRLIDANALIDEIDGIYKRHYANSSYQFIHDFFRAVFRRIHKTPTVDAVEVVRCKDCKHRGDDTYCPMCFEEVIEWDDDGYSEWDYIVHDRTIDEGFCDRGERKDDDCT